MMVENMSCDIALISPIAVVDQLNSNCDVITAFVIPASVSMQYIDMSIPSDVVSDTASETTSEILDLSPHVDNIVEFDSDCIDSATVADLVFIGDR